MDKTILDKLEGEDRRSVGRVDEVVQQVLGDTTLFDELVHGILDKDPLIRMRSADAVEKITARHPELLEPYRGLLLNDSSQIEQKEVRWHLAQILPRLEWDDEDRARVLGILLSFLGDESKIVKTFTMQALADMTEQDSGLIPQVIHVINELVETGSPAMQNRGRKLLEKLGAKQ
jgi:hypothetical protein